MQTHMQSSVVANDQRIVPDLVCPGAIGCEDTDGSFLVGAAARTITPSVETWNDQNGDGVRNAGEPFDDVNDNGRWDPVWMAGFDPGRAATSVHDDTWARALTISRGRTRVGIVVLDLLGFSHDDVVRLREAARNGGLGLDHVIVVATHTHESQDPIGFGGEYLIASGYDAAYNQRVIDRAVEALGEAIASESEASVRIARTEAPAYVADSRLPEIIDQTMFVLRFDAADRTTATLVLWGNHPETLDGHNTAITSDYPHFLRRDMEAAYPGSVAIFAPGTLGGLMTTLNVVGCPDPAGVETCPNGTFEKAEYVGSGAANAAISALDAPLAEDADPELAFRVHSFLARVTNPELLGALQLGVAPREMFRTDGTRVGAAEEDLAPLLPYDEILTGDVRIQTEVNSLSIGPITILTVPGEVYPELWMDDGEGHSLAQQPLGADYPLAPLPPSVQSLMPRDTIRAIMNQSNDAIGYIIPQTQWDRLPPYAYTEDAQYGEGVSLGSHMADALHDEVVRMYALRVY
jgi:hypothetical protein